MNSANRTALFVFTLASLAWNVPAAAQEDPGAEQLVDRIIAIVGDSAILMSEVEQGLGLLAARGWTRPTDPDQLLEVRRNILDQLIDEQLMAQDAAQDTTIIVDSEQVDDAVDQEIEAQVQRFGTQGAFQIALEQQGFTPASYREDRREFFRRQMVKERYLAKRALDPTAILVSDEELQQFYDENLAQMPQRPSTIEFINHRLSPQASDSAKESALARAHEVLAEARLADADFEELARKHSMGPTRDVGGQLNWIRENRQFDPDFEKAVFSLRPGIVSDPVETQFGYHLILVERVRGGERRVRHILFIPTVTEDDVDDNLVRAQDAKLRLDAGETVDGLGPMEVDTLVVPTDRLGDISSFYARAMANAQEGDVLGPLAIDDPQRENVMGVAKVVAIREGGVASLEEMRPQIQPMIQDTKLVENVVADLRARVYIDIRLTGN